MEGDYGVILISDHAVRAVDQKVHGVDIFIQGLNKIIRSVDKKVRLVDKKIQQVDFLVKISDRKKQEFSVVQPAVPEKEVRKAKKMAGGQGFEPR